MLSKAQLGVDGALVFSLSSKNKTLEIRVKNYAKVTAIKIFFSCSILLDLFTLFRISLNMETF